MTILYVTCKDKAEAKKISKHLLNKNLIACANIFPIESIYKWENKIKEDSEIVILLKTSDNHIKKINEEIKSIHSYDIPCILQIDAKANKEFQDWVNSQIT